MEYAAGPVIIIFVQHGPFKLLVEERHLYFRRIGLRERRERRRQTGDKSNPCDERDRAQASYCIHS